MYSEGGPGGPSGQKLAPARTVGKCAPRENPGVRQAAPPRPASKPAPEALASFADVCCRCCKMQHPWPAVKILNSCRWISTRPLGNRRGAVSCFTFAPAPTDAERSGWDKDREGDGPQSSSYRDSPPAGDGGTGIGGTRSTRTHRPLPARPPPNRQIACRSRRPRFVPLIHRLDPPIRRSADPPIRRPADPT